MSYRYLIAITITLLTATPSVAGWHRMRANDTGGIIPWSEAVALSYRQIAADHCAQFDKYAMITSVHRRYGDYVGFRCYFPRGHDPRKDLSAAPRNMRAPY